MVTTYFGRTTSRCSPTRTFVRGPASRATTSSRWLSSGLSYRGWRKGSPKRAFRMRGTILTTASPATIRTCPSRKSTCAASSCCDPAANRHRGPVRMRSHAGDEPQDGNPEGGQFLRDRRADDRRRRHSGGRAHPWISQGQHRRAWSRRVPIADCDIAVDPLAVEECVLSIFEGVFDNIAEAINHLDDVVLLTGRPMRLPQMRSDGTNRGT